MVTLRGTAAPGILHGGFHLADSGDHVLGLGDDLFLLLGHKTHLVVQGLGQGCEQLCWREYSGQSTEHHHASIIGMGGGGEMWVR
jgi:hypothetical protein